MNRLRKLCLSAGLTTPVLLLVTGCMVGPNYKRPSAPAPPAFKGVQPPPASAGVAWKQAGEDVGTVPPEWWKIYKDPTLDRIEVQVAQSNQSLKAAYQAYVRSRDQIRIERSALFPAIGVSSGASRNRASAHRPFVIPSSRNDYGDLTLQGQASWEPDLWGRIRRTVESARASAQASAADLADVQLSLQAEAAIDYFQLRALDAQEALLAQTVVDYQKAVDLTTLRFQHGLSSDADLALAQTQLDQTKAQASDVGVARAQYEDALATLTGTPASTFALAGSPLLLTPPAVPAALPSQLLERRPDISAAERRIASANAQIGVAQAAFYPTLNLGSASGFESVSPRSWLTGPSTVWTLGMSAAETIFDGGRRRAVKSQAIADYEQSTAQYRQTVLTVFQEVEDNLAALRTLQVESGQQAAAVKDAERSMSISNALYTRGLANYIQVVTVQTTLLANQRTAVDINARQATASVQLLKALGGGWTTAQLPH